MSEELSGLEIEVLRSIGDGESIEKMAKRLGAKAPALGMAIATLQVRGYLAEDGALTPKGRGARG